jgi:hypothetical protein
MVEDEVVGRSRNLAASRGLVTALEAYEELGIQRSCQARQEQCNAEEICERPIRKPERFGEDAKGTSQDPGERLRWRPD